MSNKLGDFFQTFVAFSEYLNFKHTYLSSQSWHTVQPHNLFECSEKYTRYTKGKTNKKAGRWSSSGWPLKAWRFFHSVALCFDNIQTGKYWVTITFIGQKWNGSVFLYYTVPVKLGDLPTKILFCLIWFVHLLLLNGRNFEISCYCFIEIWSEVMIFW